MFLQVCDIEVWVYFHGTALMVTERFPRFLACRCCHWRAQDEAVSASCEVVSWDSLIPDLLICRSVVQLTKHSLFCQVPPVRVFSMHVVSNPYRVPMLDAEQDVSCSMCDYLDLPASVPRHLGAEFKVVGGYAALLLRRWAYSCQRQAVGQALQV